MIKDKFIRNKSEKAINFTCQYCNKDKKSKTTVIWEKDNITKTICNGCYGQLLSMMSPTLRNKNKNKTQNR